MGDIATKVPLEIPVDNKLVFDIFFIAAECHAHLSGPRYHFCPMSRLDSTVMRWVMEDDL